MLVEKLSQEQAMDCNLYVMAAYAPEAERAVAILRDALSRQGSRPHDKGNRVLGVATHEHQFSAIYLLLDEDMLHRPALRSMLRPGALVVVATDRMPNEIGWYLPEWAGTICTVDAEAIASELGADLSVVLLGAAARVSNLIDADVLCAAVHHNYDSSHPYLAGASMRACDIGYQHAHF